MPDKNLKGVITFFFSNNFKKRFDWDNIKTRSFLINENRNCLYFQIRVVEQRSDVGGVKPKREPIMLINSQGEVFNSISEAAREYGINSGNLCAFLKGILKNKTDLKYYDKVHPTTP